MKAMILTRQRSLARIKGAFLLRPLSLFVAQLSYQAAFARMTFPSLSPGQFAVAQAEVETGIVLTSDGKHRHTGVGEVYRVFGSLDAARAFAQDVVSARTRVVCGIYDSEQRHIEWIPAQT